MKGEIVNLSNEILGKLYSYIPSELDYKKIVFFPDVCEGKSKITTGTAVLTNDSNWREYTLSDVGCGMTLLESTLTFDDFSNEDWDKLYNLLRTNKSNLGQLGSGNHFLDAVVSLSNEKIYFVIHTGSRLEGNNLHEYLDNHIKFDKEYENVVNWAYENRMAIKSIIEKVFGKTTIILDKVHNSFEKLSNCHTIGDSISKDGEIIIRKGSVKLLENELTLIPSNMDNDMILVKANSKINDCLNSLSHGTGRIMSRGDAKEVAKNYDYSALRKRIYIPEGISNDSIKTEAPFCYRNLDDCMALISDIVEEVDRFSPIAYIGQL